MRCIRKLTMVLLSSDDLTGGRGERVSMTLTPARRGGEIDRNYVLF